MPSKSSKRGALRSSSSRRASSRPASSVRRTQRVTSRAKPRPATTRPAAARRPAATRPAVARRSTTRSRRSGSPLRTAATAAAIGAAAAAAGGPLRRRAASRAGASSRPAPQATGATPPVRRRSPAARRRGTGTVAGAGTADLQAQVAQLQSRFAQLQGAAELSDVYRELGQVDARLSDLPLNLNALRSRGYVHAATLEGEIAALQDQWRKVRPQVQSNLNLQANRLRRQLDTASRQMNALSLRDATSIAAATTVLNSLQSQISAARTSASGLYSPPQQQLWQLEQTLKRVDRMLEQFHRSENVRLGEAEAPLLAAQAEWLRDGDEGPDGFLFLTDQRLLFEQQEKVATEKLFGLFTTSSEEVERLLLEVPVPQIEKVEEREEGGFLGLGKQEILSIIFAARAPVSRARFKLEDQDAAEWLIWIKRVQTGQIENELVDAYAEKVDAAEAVVFPTQCPSCFAPLPPPQRGADAVVCDYCGTVVGPLQQDAGAPAG